MAHPHHHALSSVKKWGGQISDYIALHEFFDLSKAHLADFRHRALRHHSLGIFQLEEAFGKTITLSSGRVIPTRWVGEQHVTEDLGFIPTWADWCRAIRPERWMTRSKKLSLELEPQKPADDATTPDAMPPAPTDDIALVRAQVVLTAYAGLSLSPVNDSDEGIAAVIADLLHLAATKTAGPPLRVSHILNLAREHFHAEHAASAPREAA